MSSAQCKSGNGAGSDLVTVEMLKEATVKTNVLPENLVEGLLRAEGRERALVVETFAT